MRPVLRLGLIGLNVRTKMPVCPGTLELRVFFFDAGVIAGADGAVSWFWSLLQAELVALGLEVNFDKCVVSSRGKKSHTF